MIPVFSYLFEVAPVETHVAVQRWGVLEAFLADATLDRLRLAATETETEFLTCLNSEVTERERLCFEHVSTGHKRIRRLSLEHTSTVRQRGRKQHGDGD